MKSDAQRVQKRLNRDRIKAIVKVMHAEAHAGPDSPLDQAEVIRKLKKAAERKAKTYNDFVATQVDQTTK